MASPTADQINTFLSTCQEKASEGIIRMSSEMLSSWRTTMTRPELSYADYDFSVPAIPVIPEFILQATYEDLTSTLVAHKDHVWEAEEAQYIWDQIRASFVSGGIGLTQSLQNAIFNTDRERKLQVLNDSLQAVTARLGSRGFNIPNNMLTGPRNEIIQKYQFDYDNQSREIVKLMEEHARTNWQFCVDKGIGLEQFHADFTNKYDVLFIEMIKASLDKYRIAVEVELNAFRTKLESINAILQTAKLRIDASATGLNAEIEKAKLEVDIAAKAATIAVQSHSAEVSRLSQAYSSYADLVKSFANTAMGGRLDVINYKG